jgi:NhaP-type Na+/H+ and K+/H+ antiporter
MQIAGGRADAVQAQAAADPDHGDAESMVERPPAPLPGYQVIEIAVTGDSPAAGRRLGDLTWPPDATVVSVLRDRHLRAPDSELTLSVGDQVSLLVPAPPEVRHSHSDGSGDGRPAGRTASAGSGAP